MVVPRGIFGSGTVTGSGNINGNPTQTFARSISLTMVNINDNNADAIFGSGIMTFNNFFPQYMIDYMPESTPLLITVSGLVSGDEAMNGQTFQVMRASQTIIDVDGSFSTFINTFNLSGHHAYEKYDHVWNWNS
jgi:hypothetical protein